MEDPAEATSAARILHYLPHLGPVRKPAPDCSKNPQKSSMIRLVPDVIRGKIIRIKSSFRNERIPLNAQGYWKRFDYDV